MNHREGGTASTARRSLAPLLVVLAVIGAACSSGSSNRTTDATASSTTATTTVRDLGVKFAECMRVNGVADFPDPDATGDFTYGVSVSPEQWKKTLDACKALQPPGTLSGKRNPEQQSVALRFAQCVRDHGVKDFPDPVNGDPLIDTTKIPSSDSDAGMQILNAATHACGTLLEQGARAHEGTP